MMHLLLAQPTDPLTMTLSSWWFVVMVALLGASVGSFLNVVIARLPKGMSIVSPGSHCFACGAPVAWYDNIPVVSYFVLRGRCRHCGASFSAIHMLVELIGAVLAVACFEHARAHIPAVHLARFVAEYAFCSFMVVIAFIDAKTWIIPNKLTYPGLIIFWSLAILTGRLTWWDASIGAFAGFGLLASVIVVYGLITGRQGMGWGDVKLLALIGAYLGWMALAGIILLAAVQGLILAIAAMALGRLPTPSQAYEPLVDKEEADSKKEPSDRNDAENPPSDHRAPKTEDEADHVQTETPDDDAARANWRQIPLPFGPFLALAAVEMLFFADRIYRVWLM
ncbi:MAG: prepilin peptidase [Deltaproteobacteria bacterium]|nr:prepilin peptidase [Deltaproteobacteria bacterium]